jgi:hypothetical protein
MIQRYSYAWTDPREVFGLIRTGEKLHRGKLPVENSTPCPYCRTLYVEQTGNCTNCGAPKK